MYTPGECLQGGGTVLREIQVNTGLRGGQNVNSIIPGTGRDVAVTSAI